MLKGRRPDLVDEEYVDSSDSDEDTAYPDSVLADYRSDPSDRLLQNHEQVCSSPLLRGWFKDLTETFIFSVFLIDICAF